MNYERQRLASVAAALSRAYPDVSPNYIGNYCDILAGWARRMHSAAVRLCNQGDYQPQFDKLKERIRKDVNARMGEDFPTMRLVLGGDPRGASCLRVVIPGSGGAGGFEDRDEWPV